MRSYFGSLVLSGLLLVWATTGAATSLRVAIDGEYPPFSYVDGSGKLTGFDVDFALAMCEQLRVQCELVRHGWDNLLQDLRANKYDAVIASMSITTQRKFLVEFTNKYYATPSRFVRRKGSGIEIAAESLRHKRIGVAAQSVQDSYLTDLYQHISSIQRYPNDTALQQGLLKGEVDLIAGDELGLQIGFLNTPEGHAFEFVGPKLDEPEWFGDGIGIAVRHADQTLKGQLNKAIVELRANGGYKKVQDKYFNFDIYGQ